MSSNLFKSLVEILNQKNISYELIEHEGIMNVDEGINLLKFSEEETLKTLAFTDGKQSIFLVLQGRRNVDYKKLAQALEVKRSNLKKLSADIVVNQLGYQVGGLSPLHKDENISVYFDEKIAQLTTVYCGIGLRNKTLKILSKDLISASNGQLIAFAKD